MNYDPAPFLFLRPMWLVLLLLVPVAGWLLHRSRNAANVWDRYVDSNLRGAVIEPGAASRSWLGSLWLSLLLTTAIIALAGPSVRKSEQPLADRVQPLLIVENMSSAMLSNDVGSLRMDLANRKIGSVLKTWEGDVGMVAYADQPFTVSPLTQDPRNVAIFLDQLNPDVMPRDGENLAMAIDYAVQILKRDSQVNGTIWVVSPSADAGAVQSAAAARAQGFRVAVLGMGQGKAFDETTLRAVATAGGGAYQRVKDQSDRDLQSLDLAQFGGTALNSRLSTERNGYVRQDNGFWLLPLLLILAPFAFRRRQMAITPLLAVAAMLLVLGAPTPAWAQQVQAPVDLSRDTLWATAQQRQARQAQQADAAYKAKNYAQAAGLYSRIPGAQARYNEANALAKTGEYRAAIAAYDLAIAGQPKNLDARVNKAIVEKALKSQLNSFNKPSDSPQTRQNQPNPGDQLKKQQEAMRQQRLAMAAAERQKQQQQSAQQPQRIPDDINPQTGKPYTAQERRERDDLKRQLAKVRDDPGGLLRAKFYLEYVRRFQTQGGTP